MPEPSNTIAFRLATAADVVAIAALHADSWRRHYRGAYSDAYLDGPVDEERLAVWTERFSRVDARTRTVLAHAGDELVGFVHVIVDEHPDWGALVDNLHVRHDVQRSGLGRTLMARAAEFVVTERHGSPLYLWVLEQNTRAQAFYQSIGGREEDSKASEQPGGTTVVGLRYVWPDPVVLIAPR